MFPEYTVQLMLENSSFVHETLNQILFAIVQSTELVKHLSRRLIYGNQKIIIFECFILVLAEHQIEFCVFDLAHLLGQRWTDMFIIVLCKTPQVIKLRSQINICYRSEVFHKKSA